MSYYTVHPYFATEPFRPMMRSEYTYKCEANSTLAAAEAAYMYFNHDNRPNGQTERSLSVGDIVAVRNDVTNITEVLIINVLGYTPIIV